MVPTTSEPAFVSHQVTESRRYYLNLSPPKRCDVAVVCGGCERVRPDYRVQRETFPFFAIEFVAEGAGTLTLKGSRWELQPGVAFAYGGTIPHLIETDPQRPMLKYYVDFVGQNPGALLKKSPLGNWEPVQVSSPHEIIKLFEQLQGEAREEGPLVHPICNSLLPVLIQKIHQLARPAGTADPRALASYQRARRYIEGHFLQLRTASEIAAACHMSPMHLSRLFKRFGQSGAYQFLMKLKMNHAAMLLIDGGLMVKEAASTLGFSDAFHFSRVFKRVYGVAPEKFIRQLDGQAAQSQPRYS